MRVILWVADVLERKGALAVVATTQTTTLEDKRVRSSIRNSVFGLVVVVGGPQRVADHRQRQNRKFDKDVHS
jgi:hypothetical protein